MLIPLFLAAVIAATVSGTPTLGAGVQDSNDKVARNQVSRAGLVARMEASKTGPHRRATSGSPGYPSCASDPGTPGDGTLYGFLAGVQATRACNGRDGYTDQECAQRCSAIDACQHWTTSSDDDMTCSVQTESSATVTFVKNSGFNAGYKGGCAALAADTADGGVADVLGSCCDMWVARS